jgi:hypothetical protein
MTVYIELQLISMVDITQIDKYRHQQSTTKSSHEPVVQLTKIALKLWLPMIRKSPLTMHTSCCNSYVKSTAIT